jgi:hypothetical protein
MDSTVEPIVSTIEGLDAFWVVFTIERSVA